MLDLAAGSAMRVFQLPSYSPDYNPIEFLWKKMKQRATHNQYFPQFEALISSVEAALTDFANQAEEIKSLMGLYVESILACGFISSCTSRQASCAGHQWSLIGQT